MSNNEEVIIHGVKVKFQPQILGYETSNEINQIEVVEALKCLTFVLNDLKVEYFASYGTLLGFVRENKLLAYDIDCDFSIKGEIDFVKSIPELEKIGFILVRYQPTVMYTLMRNGNYYDFYILKSFGTDTLKNILLGLIFFVECGFLVPKFYFKKMKQFKFEGALINIPHNSVFYLKYIYTKNWKIPMKNTPGYGANGFFEGIQKFIFSFF